MRDIAVMRDDLEIKIDRSGLYTRAAWYSRGKIGLEDIHNPKSQI